MDNTLKYKILLCAPGENVGGGINAVVYGYEKGFKKYTDLIDYRKICYGKRVPRLGKLKRILSEIYQLILFIVEIVRYQPAIIHVQSSFDKKTIVRDSIHLWVSLILNRKFILHAHGGEWHLIPSWNTIWRWYTQKFLKHCHHVIVTSQDEKNIIKNFFGEKFHVDKICNPVVLPVDVTKMDNIKRKKDNVKTIIFAARLIEAKGVMDILNAVPLIERNDFRIKIYGQGILFNKARELIKILNIDEKVTLVGQVTIEELVLQYAASEIYCFPSYHLEGFPMSFFYAVACGMAIITTKVRPIPEYLLEPDNCLWITPQNPSSIAAQINYLLERPKMIENMSHNNKQLAKEFSDEKIVKDLIKVYQRLFTLS